MLKSRAGEARRGLMTSVLQEAVLRGRGKVSDEPTTGGASCKGRCRGFKGTEETGICRKKLQEEMKRAAVIDARFAREQASEALSTY